MRLAAPLSRKDRAIVAMLAFFSAFNLTLDLYYVTYARELEARASTSWLAWLWVLYSDADRFWIVGPWSFAQEWFNVYVTTLVNLWLVWAILKDRPYRPALQLALGSYLSYSVVLYFLAAHVSGYAGMRRPTPGNVVLFYGATLPWLLAHLYIAGDAFVAITRRFAALTSGPAARS